MLHTFGTKYGIHQTADDIRNGAAFPEKTRVAPKKKRLKVKRKK